LDRKQLYDLHSDPDQKVNLIAEYESYRSSDSSGYLAAIITIFESMMADYVKSTCPMLEGECLTPSFSFCSVTDILEWSHKWSSVSSFSNSVARSKLRAAERLIEETYPDCAPNISSADYVYEFTYQRWQRKLSIDVQICCGSDDTVFPGDYVEPTGYSYSGDAAFNFDEVNSSTDWHWMKAAVVAFLASMFCSVCIAAAVVFRRKIQRRRHQQTEAIATELGAAAAVVPETLRMSAKIERSVCYIEDNVNMAQHVHATKKRTDVATKIAVEIVARDEEIEQMSPAKEPAAAAAKNRAVANAFDL